MAVADEGWACTRWHLTDTADVLLETGARRIYDFGAGVLDRDRRWLVLLASVPERDRNLRYRMSVGLNWAGFGSLGQGTWLSPWTSQEAAVVQLLEELGVNATSFLAKLGRIGSGAELAAQAWDLPALRERYDAFMVDTEKARRPRRRRTLVGRRPDRPGPRLAALPLRRP